MSLKEEFKIKSNELFKTLKKIIEEGNVNHIAALATHLTIEVEKKEK